MIIGTVTGSVWATRKDEKLNGLKLMVVAVEQKKSVMTSIIAADIVGAGQGDQVIITMGSSARLAVSRETMESKIPVDAAIIGIVDSVES
ncbi:EutN/CcmL family microcompartment protein [Vagococcus sp. BWB3-3]|uniref:EutN/CcmL family microcompartment protein n=1 Tax=Vagococcus allomyrinae TaxID=2794353 RepID=A0A940P7T3_9ENTE|nr:EutN/CcmL family microcompartment protein [Vagococcus allomyrinae]MBP1039527.1 EutN/CcmL family microcompartment protein [Vagococcus allomyrinae]